MKILISGSTGFVGSRLGTFNLSSNRGSDHIVPIPEFALKLMFGQMAEETLLVSTKVSSEKLINSGYKFKYPDITEFFNQEFK